MDDETLIEAVPLKGENEISWAMMLAALAAVIIVTVILILRNRRKQKNTFLIVGLSEAGKTLIYSKLINQG